MMFKWFCEAELIYLLHIAQSDFWVILWRELAKYLLITQKKFLGRMWCVWGLYCSLHHYCSHHHQVILSSARQKPHSVIFSLPCPGRVYSILSLQTSSSRYLTFCLPLLHFRSLVFIPLVSLSIGKFWLYTTVKYQSNIELPILLCDAHHFLLSFDCGRHGCDYFQQAFTHSRGGRRDFRPSSWILKQF